MTGFFVKIAWLVPFFPLLGGLTAAAGGRWLKSRAHWPVVIGIALAFLVSLGLLASAGPDQRTIVYRWFTAGSLAVPIEFRVDGLTTMMLSMVTFVSTLVAVFAIGYMEGEEGYPRFFAVVGLFVFSMTGLLLSGNYLLTYAFWEGVGVCSYLLIGFWHSKPSAAAAAKKAFLVNRIGDVGFAIAIFWLWMISTNHDLSYDVVLSRANLLGNLNETAATGIALLLFWAATAKSAQIPLYVWLPDAMEGPTPVSALIHAATMVTAGVYLIARSMPLMIFAPLVLMTVAIVGCLTALLAALIALTQTDLKRVLAYSTVSQLGFMFMGLGAGVGNVARFAVVAAMFHLFTHAFFKALLFLGSGSVMHAMGGVIDMRRFRGLRHRMPYTFATFTVGVLALSGIPPLAGFFSKDEILIALKSAARWMNSEDGLGLGGVYYAIYWTAIFTAFLTAFYSGRAYFLTFFGPEKLPGPDDPEAEVAGDATLSQDHSEDHAHADAHGHGSHFGHESGRVMTVPLMVLAACAVLVGMVFGPTHLFAHHLDKTLGFEELTPRVASGTTAPGATAAGALKGHVEGGERHEFEPSDSLTPIIGTIVGVLGLALSFFLYAKPSPIPAKLAFSGGRLYRASLDKFRVDEVYDSLVVGPTIGFAKFIEFLDIYLVDGLVRAASWIPRVIGRELLGPFQNGLVQFYAGVTVAGVTALLWILLLN